MKVTSSHGHHCRPPEGVLTTHNTNSHAAALYKCESSYMNALLAGVNSFITP